MMYHVFEHELKSISSLNSRALSWLSVGSFSLAIAGNLAISAIFASSPMSDTAVLVTKYGLTASVGLGLFCFGFGGWAIISRRSVINQIKEETKTGDPQQ